MLRLAWLVEHGIKSWGFTSDKKIVKQLGLIFNFQFGAEFGLSPYQWHLSYVLLYFQSVGCHPLYIVIYISLYARYRFP
jgi:hypothetical protein